MTENAPPAPSTTADPTRGLPYYEKLRKDLRETLQKKRLLDKHLATLEDQIYRYETSYLEETTAGNIIKGFDNYIKGATTTSSSAANNNSGGGGGGTSNARRKGGVNDTDRIFSRSSASFMRELSPPSSSSHTTPSHSHGPTPTTSQPPGAGGREGSAPHSAGLKAPSRGGGDKKKKGEREREREEEGGEEKAPKRLKITYARGGVGD